MCREGRGQGLNIPRDVCREGRGQGLNTPRDVCVGKGGGRG